MVFVVLHAIGGESAFRRVPSQTGEVTVVVQVLAHAGILKSIDTQMRFACARFGLNNGVAILIGFAVPHEPTSFAEPLICKGALNAYIVS